jgi:TatD DNase family protein
VIERAVEAGIERICVPGWDRASSEAAVQLAARYPGLLVPAAGIHPHHVAAATESDWRAIEALAAEPAVVAVGEIGLDFYRDLSPRDAQRAALARQLEIAAAVRKPVLVHDREAHDEVTNALEAWQPPLPVRGVLHCFSGDASMAERVIRAGYLVSCALAIRFRAWRAAREAVSALPADAILVETDAPYLGSTPGGRNEPVIVLSVAADLARLRGTEAQAVAARARQAWERLFAG